MKIATKDSSFIVNMGLDPPTERKTSLEGRVLDL